MRYCIIRIILPFLICSLVLIQPALAAVNPKEVSSATISIAKSGTLTPSGNIMSASLTLYIAQEGGQSIEVSPGDWEYADDANGNKMVRIHFNDLKQPQAYSLAQTVKTVSQRLDSETALGSGSKYTAETAGAQITPNISATAYPFPRTLAGVAAMTSWVHGYMTYDISLFGQSRPSDWVLANRRGVCVEFSNLLAAMLRSRGIPVRYANGYAYSAQNSSLIGHAWVEVLAGGTGGSAAGAASQWVGFDPIWLEGGLIDATHVKTSSSLDGVEKETLTYLGNGDVDWQKNPDATNLLEYTTDNSTAISLEAPQNLPLVGGGYLKATVAYLGCRMTQLSVSPCTSNHERNVLSVQGGDTRDLWLCSSASAFWAFTTALGKGTYSCPVLVYDQSGAEAEKEIQIGGEASGQAPSITGPDSAAVNRPFTLQASHGSMPFSPDFGEGQNQWTLTLSSPGTYDFYAYANGQLASKSVAVSAVQEFELTASAPALVNQSMTFLITSSLRNIGSLSKAVTARAVFGNQTLEKQASIDSGQTADLTFNFTAYDAGITKYTVSALSDTYAGYSGSVDVIPAPEKPKGIIDTIMEAIKGFIGWLMGLFSSR